MSAPKSDKFNPIDNKHQTQSERRLPWIDFCKGIAMLAVIIDHCYGSFYTSRVIQHHTIFSVTLFVFIGGITSAISLQNSNRENLKNISQRIQRIIYPFLLSTLCWSIYYEKGKFVMVNYLSLVIHFKATGAYYFICFFIQLIAFSPIIYYFVCKYNNYKTHLCVIISSAILSILFQKYTFILMLHGGGKYLFGGTYLFVFTLGMIFFRYRMEIFIHYHGILILVVAIISLICIEMFHLLPKGWSNPPNIIAIAYTLSVFSIVYFTYNICQFRKINRLSLPILQSVKKPLKIINLIGKYSLPIFLFHNFFILIGNKYNIVSKIFEITEFQIGYIPFYALWIILLAIIPAILINNYLYKPISDLHRKIFSSTS